MVKFVLLILVIMMLGGCQILNPKPSPGPDTVYTVGGKIKPDESTVSLRSDGKAVVNYYAQADSTGAMRTIVSRFNASSTDTYVQLHELNIERNTLYTQFIMALEASDEDYDIMLIDIGWNTDFASRGLTLELSGYIDESAINLDSYLPNAISAVRYQDGIYSMPVETGISMLYYRKDIMGAIPLTWDSINLADSYPLKYSLVFGGRISYESMLFVLDLINIYGGRFLDESGYPALERPGLTAALQKYKEMHASLYLLNATQAEEAFLNGESMMLVSGSKIWMRANSKDSKVIGKFALAPIPKSDTDNFHNQLLLGTAAVIGAGSHNPDSSWEFIKFLTGESAQQILAVSGGFSPSLMKIYDDPDAQTANIFFSSNNYRNALQNAVVQPQSPDYFGYMSILQEQLGIYLSGPEDVNIILDMIEQGLNKLMGTTQ